jgi:acyl-CoA synthetase (AMP-forming)/AMP-acid ligase II
MLYSHSSLSVSCVISIFYLFIQRAVLVYPPSLDFIISFLACLKAGIVAVPVFPPNPLRRDTLHMFSRIVQGCDAKFALTNTEYNHAKKIAGIRDAFTRNTSANATAAWPEALQWILTDQKSAKATAVSSSSASTPKSTCSSSDLAFLQYTSGSTSEPKGVMITHGNLAHNLSIITTELKADATTIVVSWLPQYHDMGLIGSYLGILYCGGTGYYMSPLSFLQRPMLWMEVVGMYQATHLQAPNFSFKLTARKFQADQYTPDTLQLSSVKHVINAAEPIDENSIETFYQTFGPFGFGKVIFPTYVSRTRTPPPRTVLADDSTIPSFH